jgi:hypothetical protein
MEYRRTALVACMFAVTGLGISGIIAGGCGGDDTSGTPGTGGSAGSGVGSTGGGKGGSGGTAGSGGSAGNGGSVPADARPDVDFKAICLGSTDSGSSCLNTCLCDNCAMQSVVCLSDPPCRRLADCANANGCLDTACALMRCPGELAEAGQTGALEAVVLGMCVSAAMCNTKCAPDAAREGGSDAPVTVDAPAADRNTSDAPAADTSTSDAPAAADTSTSDAPAEASAD